MSAISENGTAINPPGPLRLRPDPKWYQRNPLKLICRLVLEEVRQTGLLTAGPPSEKFAVELVS